MHDSVRALVTASSRTVTGGKAPNYQWRTAQEGAHRSAPLVLHHTRIGKCVVKKFRINCQLRSKLFLTVIFQFSRGKAAMNAPLLCKLGRNRLTAHGKF